MLKYIITLFNVLLFVNYLFADATPFKDIEEIHLKYETSDKLTLDSCNVIDLSKDDAKQIDTFSGCEGWRCVTINNNQIITLAHVVPQRFRLILYYTSKTYISPILLGSDGNYFHELRLTDDDIHDVTSIFRTTNFNYFLALIITITIELIAASIFNLLWNFPLKDLQFVLYANLISHPILWIICANYSGFILGNIIGEPLVIVAEGYFYFKFIKPQLSISKATTLSLTLNLLSFILGGILYIILQE